MHARRTGVKEILEKLGSMLEYGWLGGSEMRAWRSGERRKHRGGEDSDTHWGDDYSGFTSLLRLVFTVITLYLLRGPAGALHHP